MAQRHEPDVAVIGGSFGGVAATLAAANAGASVLLAESSDWIGGQITAQGVSALDEHEHAETVAGTRRYEIFRERVRERYVDRGATATTADGRPLNPGNCWVSNLCFEPRIGLAALEDMLAPHVDAGRVTIVHEHEPVDAVVDDEMVRKVTLESATGAEVVVKSPFFLDATEWGTLLPLTNTSYVTGAESRTNTGERHAVPGEARPGEIQAFTYCFAVEFRPGGDHTIETPTGYEQFRTEQPYTFKYEDHRGDVACYRMFERGPDGEQPFWTYRRLLDNDVVPEAEWDLALVNWSGNDYRFANPIDTDPAERERILSEARRLARGFLYWLQTDAPRENGRTGFPGLKLRPDVMGTTDGLSKKPYVRESRRIRADTSVVEEDVAAATTDGARARRFPDSVGIAWYGLDLHSCVGNPGKVLHVPTSPFQIPLGALIPTDRLNLLPACKNIGTTHLTNGGYRTHPGEWAIGEAAGVLAAHCVEQGLVPREVRADARRLHRFQYRLLDQGVPVAWTLDISHEHPDFTTSQLLVAAGALSPASPRFDRLELRLDEPLTKGGLTAGVRAGCSLLDRSACAPKAVASSAIANTERASEYFEAAAVRVPPLSGPPTWADLCAAFGAAIDDALSA